MNVLIYLQIKSLLISFRLGFEKILGLTNFFRIGMENPLVCTILILIGVSIILIGVIFGFSNLNKVLF